MSILIMNGKFLYMKIFMPGAILCASLAGCAGTAYNMSDQAVKLQSGMNDQAAIEIIKSFLVPNEKRMGLCRHDFNYPFLKSRGGITEGQPVVEGRMIKFPVVAEATEIAGINASGGNGSVTINLKSYPVNALRFFDLSNVSQINIEKIVLSQIKPADLNMIAPCRFERDGVYVTTVKYTPYLQMLFFQLEEAEVDSFVAAVKKLSPDVRMRKYGQ
jgi:hypothetical protein